MATEEEVEEEEASEAVEEVAAASEAVEGEEVEEEASEGEAMVEIEVIEVAITMKGATEIIMIPEEAEEVIEGEIVDMANKWSTEIAIEEEGVTNRETALTVVGDSTKEEENSSSSSSSTASSIILEEETPDTITEAVSSKEAGADQTKATVGRCKGSTRAKFPWEDRAVMVLEGSSSVWEVASRNISSPPSISNPQGRGLHSSSKMYPNLNKVQVVSRQRKPIIKIYLSI